MSEQASQTRTVILSLRPEDDPRNWPSWKKWLVVASITFVDLTVSWGASGYSPAAGKFAKAFHVSGEVGTLGLSIYVAGLALGPMSLAPLSEVFDIMPISLLSRRLMLDSTLDERHYTLFHTDAFFSFYSALLS